MDRNAASPALAMTDHVIPSTMSSDRVQPVDPSAEASSRSVDEARAVGMGLNRSRRAARGTAHRDGEADERPGGSGDRADNGRGSGPCLAREACRVATGASSHARPSG